MTAQQKRNLLYWIAGAILVPLVSWGATSYDARKVSVSDYRVDMQRIESKLDRILDVACEGKQNRRACKP